MEELQELLEKKEQELEVDTKKINIIKELFKDPKCFFKLDMSTSLGILSFLGIPKDKLLDYYHGLTSIEEFRDKEGFITISNDR